ncbi:MaoC family dehydratase [Arthrobacter sp. A5]|uniref:MaoC family dehydratase n=1 Tax=Arthrobacter sp. A5 TaxID=576926 RepID=UPI003DA9198F
MSVQPQAEQGSGTRVIEQRGLYFDELESGVIYAHKPGRTVTEADNVLFTSMTMNTQALHLDAAWSSTQPFGQRLVNSMFTLATVVGQSVSQLTQGTIIAQLGLTDVKFPHPMFHGDTLYTETVITGKRLSASRPGQGIVTMAHTGRNQNGVVVATLERSCLMWTKEGHAAGAISTRPQAALADDRNAAPVGRPGEHVTTQEPTS